MSNLILRIRHSLQRIEQHLQTYLAASIFNQPHNGLAVNIPPVSPANNHAPPPQSVLDEIFSPIDYHLAPKHRRSRERRMQRQFGQHQMKRMIDIKQNLIMCLECGHWHEKRTICGNCYEKVKKETEEMKEALGEGMKYSPEQKEVEFMYENEDRQNIDGKYIVEMKKPRPKWFADSLMVKVKGGKT